MHQISSALRGCSNSLKVIKFERNRMGGERLVEITEALAVHPQLEQLQLPSMNIGRNGCAAIAFLLSHAATKLHTLDLRNNSINNEGVDALVGALTNSNLHILDLAWNQTITARGYRRIAILLENRNCSLVQLRLFCNSIGDEGALIFANALASNCKLKTLDLDSNGITAEGYSSFSKVLCDTSSINRTFLSNHTLGALGGSSLIPADLRSLLALNSSNEDRNQVAIRKILKHHHHFDMQPFFEWDLKVLPLAVNWFERARSIERIDDAGIGKHKLGAIYQFIRAMPEVFEPSPAAAGEKRKRSAIDGTGKISK